METIHSISLRRGTDAQRQQITLRLSEPAFCTDTKEFWIGDGQTLGGIRVGGEESNETTIINQIVPPTDGLITLSSSDESTAQINFNVANNTQSTITVGNESGTHNIKLDWSAANGPRLISTDASKNLKIVHNSIDTLSVQTINYLGNDHNTVFVNQSPDGTISGMVINGHSDIGSTLELRSSRDDNVLQLTSKEANTIAFRTTKLIDQYDIDPLNPSEYVAAELGDPNIDYPGNFNVGVNSANDRAGAFSVGYIEPMPFTPYTGVSSISTQIEQGVTVLNITLPPGENMDNIKYGEYVKLTIPNNPWDGQLLPVLSTNDITKEIICNYALPNGAQLSQLTAEVGNFTESGDTNLRRSTTFTTFVSGRRVAGMGGSSVDGNENDFFNHATHNRLDYHHLPVVSAANVDNLNFVGTWQLFVDSDGFVRMNLPSLVRDATTGSIIPGKHLAQTQGLDTNITDPQT